MSLPHGVEKKLEIPGDPRQSAEEIVADPVKDVAASLSNRDLLDSTRKISPLRPAEDALELDSTELDLKEVVDVIWEWLTRKNLLGLPKVAVIGR
ncbi:hypothetical protein EBT11_03365, partial [bacterium]|nr:hypothetical protein [bacterium]